jgi:hypothetical protein
MPNAILIRVANVSQISATVVHREATFGYHRVLKVFLCAISAGTDNGRTAVFCCNNSRPVDGSNLNLGKFQ